MYYRENDKVVESDNIENYALRDGGIHNKIGAKVICLYILCTVLTVTILIPIFFRNTADWIFETNEKRGFYISLILLLFITIIVLNCSCG